MQRDFMKLLDGWKHLACGLLEDRRLQKVIRSPDYPAEFVPDIAVPAVPREEAIPRPSAARNVVRHWWSHPLTSLTLCAAIAFVGGLLIPDFRGSPGSGGPSAVSASNPRFNQPHGVTTYHVQMQPGGQFLEIPAVSELSQLYRIDSNHPLFSDPSSGRGNTRWLVLPVEGNRSMLIPLSEKPGLNMQ